MTDLTYEILKAKYAPDSLLQQVEVAEPESVEVEKTSITMEELLFKVRSDYLTSCGLDPKDRHEFADQIVAWATVHKCSEYNVTNMPEGGPQ
jgi:hypothetical protein